MKSDLKEVVNTYNLRDCNYIQREFKGGEIFPSDLTPVITTDEKIKFLKWGFISKGNNKLVINARSESISEKPLFKKALYTNRCVLPANCFYEWKGEKGKKQKYRISVKGESIFSMAGIYDRFVDSKGLEYEGFVIITTEANYEMSSLHHRMPVIFKIGEEKSWLSEDIKEDFDLTSILKPYKNGELLIVPDNGYEQTSFI
ncbi:putative SOS response-associated peptidase YedK [Clostridium tetanomorphum]|uniref:Abasic site processing protein n=1 Tax=Clostridium tetanomorphum TaxID=1553 RepID=A0A923J1R6_CLOTT|nr:SOS response-associated peptidase [Clostridium tetanomorphum]MBP1865011.1 putative SOS response-associated peptidase YedK [Clostridium tetanomorphum]NRS83392.1 putative SOS response-associated peptidase YedK [Clostridium tetanomorphum]NRZ96591.1 putative SOS response-associated peptidase YedK [Clostridium tetanomorphum]